MKNRFQKNYFSFLGDSITTLEGYVPDGYPSFYTLAESAYTGVRFVADTWWGQVIAALDAHLLVNNAWSGSYVCRAPRCEIESYGCSPARTGGLDRDGITPDHIIVYMGNNDRGAGFPLVSDDPDDLTVFTNAYDTMLARLCARYPHAEVWCCTFPLTHCARNHYKTLPRVLRGVDLTEHNLVIASVAADYDCHVIDLFDEAHPVDTIDGLHPSMEGMRAIAERVLAQMQ